MGYTQAEAAEALGLGRRVIAYFESGERNVSKTVALLCAAIEKQKRKR
jgi:transcriptional regulator with XRE-family HTH domain